MLRVAQGAPSRRERSNCGADEWTQHEPSLQTTNEQAPVKNAQRPERACARRPKYIRQSQSGQWAGTEISANGHDCESALGGRADTLFAGKAEMTAKIAIERQTRSLACCRRAKALHAGDERKPCVLASSGNELWVLSQRILPTTGGPAQQVDARRTRARGPP